MQDGNQKVYSYKQKSVITFGEMVVANENYGNAVCDERYGFLIDGVFYFIYEPYINHYDAGTNILVGHEEIVVIQPNGYVTYLQTR